ncbi:fructosamine kinase family protein [Nonlabens xiamenensis]|uniref:fructosamine kinase family protein n=1 Tax=Nonlabens xiamenensis TaxID=2341043 RepID=UPI000F608ADF|nr:fructosamine kinase family protein [Nonlabens xiamenensis]
MGLPADIRAQIHLNINATQPLSGGDINEVHKLTTSSGDLVIKLNDKDRFPGMLYKEKLGLEWLSSCPDLKVPTIIQQGETERYQYLVMEYIPTGTTPVKVKTLSKTLAALHQQTHEHFGASTDNYIGSLPQSNKRHSTAATFYWEERLQPQIHLAQKKGFNLPVKNLKKRILELVPTQPPALIHGDLWSGNLLTDPAGDPVFIDPAAHYGIAEMDLAMMRLFGGFSEEVFELYHQYRSPIVGWQDRIALFQLYYLLVHLNLFGSAYLGRVTSIIQKYS